MALKSTGGGELAQLVADHILGDVNRHVLATVVDGEGVADKVRENGGGAAPGLEDALLTGLVHLLNPFHQHRLYERTLLYASTQKS